MGNLRLWCIINVPQILQLWETFIYVLQISQSNHEQPSVSFFSDVTRITMRLGYFLDCSASSFPSSVQFSRSVVSNSLRPHRLQHARLPCPSPTPRVYSNSCPLSQWYHPVISSSVVPFSCLQVFPASGSFSKESVLCTRWPKYWSFSFSISLSREYSGWFLLGLIGLIALQSKGLSRVFSNITVHKHQFFGTQLALWSNSHIHTWLLEKP